MKYVLLAVAFVGLIAARSMAIVDEGRLQHVAEDVQRDLGPNATKLGGKMLLLQLTQGIAARNPQLIETALRELAVTVNSDQVREECNALYKDLRAEREAREAKLGAKVEQALEHAKTAVPTAKRAADLDGVLQELNALHEQAAEGEVSAEISGKLNEVDPALQFVAAWQEYLADIAAGNYEGARAALQNLIAPNQNVPFLIPRSEILDRMNFMLKPEVSTGDADQSNQASVDISGTATNPSPENPTLDKPLFYIKETHSIGFHVTKLDDLSDLVDALEKTRDDPALKSLSGDVGSILRSVMPLANAYQSFKGGLPVNLSIPEVSDQSTQIENDLIPLRAELITMALPRYLGMPSDEKPKPGEGAYDLLKRIETEAKAKGDYLLAARARDAEHSLLENKPPEPPKQMPENLRMMMMGQMGYGRTTPVPASAEVMQAQIYVTAHDEDVAGQYRMAVTAYESALAVGTDLVPPDVIGKRLANIKAEHPTEYQEGVEDYANPALNRYQGYTRMLQSAAMAGRNPMQMGRMGPPGTLSIPGTNQSTGMPHPQTR